MKQKGMTRREFFIGAAAVGAVPAVAKAMMAGTEFDENLSVFISDIHVSGPDIKGTLWGDQPTYQNPYFERAVDEILAMRPRPRRVVCFGDVALWFGFRADYEASRPGFGRLTDAGIDVHLAMGNHDRREPFLEVYPQYAKTSPVPGRIVSVVNLGTCDLILLDSLDQTKEKEGTPNGVGGTIDRAQWDWLKEECMRRTRPFFCGAHHDYDELTLEVEPGKRASVLSFLKNAPYFRGWISGHHHFWTKGRIFKAWNSPDTIRTVILPSTGWKGDIGYATMRTSADRAVLSLVQYDYYFPKPLGKGVPRPREWDEIIAENRGQRCTFPL